MRSWMDQLANPKHDLRLNWLIRSGVRCEKRVTDVTA